MDDYLYYAPPKEREQRLRLLAEAAEVLRRARTAKRVRERATQPTRSPKVATLPNDELRSSPGTLPTFDDAA